MTKWFDRMAKEKKAVLLKIDEDQLDKFDTILQANGVSKSEAVENFIINFNKIYSNEDVERFKLIVVERDKKRYNPKKYEIAKQGDESSFDLEKLYLSKAKRR